LDYPSCWPTGGGWRRKNQKNGKDGNDNSGNRVGWPVRALIHRTPEHTVTPPENSLLLMEDRFSGLEVVKTGLLQGNQLQRKILPCGSEKISKNNDFKRPKIGNNIIETMFNGITKITIHRKIYTAGSNSPKA
jgi:hypothetical protein